MHGEDNIKFICESDILCSNSFIDDFEGTVLVFAQTGSETARKLKLLPVRRTPVFILFFLKMWLRIKCCNASHYAVTFIPSTSSLHEQLHKWWKCVIVVVTGESLSVCYLKFGISMSPDKTRGKSLFNCKLNVKKLKYKNINLCYGFLMLIFFLWNLSNVLQPVCACSLRKSTLYPTEGADWVVTTSHFNLLDNVILLLVQVL